MNKKGIHKNLINLKKTPRLFCIGNSFMQEQSLSERYKSGPRRVK